MKVLVTGACGFVGNALSHYLLSAGYDVNGTVRVLPASPVFGDAPIRLSATGPIESCCDWHEILEGVDVVVHLAARVHQMEGASLSAEQYREVNVDATRQLAQAAAETGVRRLVFISSIKVNGEGREAAYTETDAPQPEDTYAVSKLAAEECLAEVAAESGLEVVVLRPPLIYGPGVRANFYRLISLVERRIPLPLGRIQNRRSMLYVGNLVSAIEVCLDHPTAAGETFLVSDGEDVSTPELIRRIAAGLNLRPGLWSVPQMLLKFAALLAGKNKEMARLSSSLQIDSSRLRKTLDWTPPFSLDSGLLRTLDWYREEQGR